MKTIALVLLFLSFVAITTAQSQGCIVVNGNSECPAPTQWQSPNTASGSTNRGPAPFNELEAFQVCSGSCSANRRACIGGNYNVSVELQACDVSTATNDQFVSGFDNDTCLTWGYAPARVVQTIEITIDCSAPQCQCMYIPQALVLSVSNINDYVFGVVFTNGNPAISIENTVTCPSSACVAPPPVFDGTVTTASITTGTGIITTGTPPPPSSSTIVPSSNASSSSSSSLALILGLALGLGIPFVLCCCLLIIAGIILLILFLKRGGVSSNTFWMPSRS